MGRQRCRVLVLLALTTVTAAVELVPSAVGPPVDQLTAVRPPADRLSAVRPPAIRPPTAALSSIDLSALLPAAARPSAFLPPENPGERCPSDQECVSILGCDAYRTREDILKGKPKLCGFFGRTPRVCCDRPEPVTEEPQSPLPLKCGEQRFSFESVPSSDRFRREASPRNLDKPVAVGPVSTPLPPVVGGKPVALAPGPKGNLVHRWPWMVLFGRWTDGQLGQWFCGGTLITARHVLTAAHCLRPEEAGAVGVRVADHDLRNSSEVDHQERNVSSIAHHPQYLGSQNDLAVVRLAAPVELTDSVQPICLPPAGAEHLGRDVDVAGWGLLEFGGVTSDVLQEAPLRVTDPDACEAAYRRVPQFEAQFPGGFQGTKVCAGSRDDEPRDACSGDSGGPLMALQTRRSSNVFSRRVYQLVGVVSTGMGCGNSQFPGVYTKVSAYIHWIVGQLT